MLKSITEQSNLSLLTALSAGSARREALFFNRNICSFNSPFLRYAVFMGKWCTVTVTDGDGKRYSLDINANSSYDAAHLYLTHVTAHPGCGLPIPTTTTTFEVIADGKVFHVQGARLKRWIEKRREEWNGPRGLLFKQRPIIGE